MALAGFYLRHSPTQKIFGTQRAREFQGHVYLVGYDSLSPPEIPADGSVEFEITTVLQLLYAPVNFFFDLLQFWRPLYCVSHCI